MGANSNSFSNRCFGVSPALTVMAGLVDQRLLMFLSGKTVLTSQTGESSPTAINLAIRRDLNYPFTFPVLLLETPFQSISFAHKPSWKHPCGGMPHGHPNNIDHSWFSTYPFSEVIVPATMEPKTVNSKDHKQQIRSISRVLAMNILFLQHLWFQHGVTNLQLGKAVLVCCPQRNSNDLYRLRTKQN